MTIQNIRFQTPQQPTALPKESPFNNVHHDILIVDHLNQLLW
jgi:hypothetical protein